MLAAEKLGVVGVEPLVARLAGLVSKFDAAIGYRVLCAAVFGSQATGTATASSDIDVLIVVKAERVVADDYALLARLARSVLPKLAERLSPIILSEKDARTFRRYFLDMLSSKIVLMDRQGFLAELLDQCAAKMEELGASRQFDKDGLPLWIITDEAYNDPRLPLDWEDVARRNQRLIHNGVADLIQMHNQGRLAEARSQARQQARSIAQSTLHLLGIEAPKVKDLQSLLYASSERAAKLCGVGLETMAELLGEVLAECLQATMPAAAQPNIRQVLARLKQMEDIYSRIAATLLG